MARIFIYSNQHYAWCIPPFLYLRGVYWSNEQPVVIGGCEPFETPPNVEWLHVESRVKERWSDGLIECLQQMDDDRIIWALEDYWLVRTVDVDAVGSLDEYMSFRPDVLKIDLTADRLHSGAATDEGYWGHSDLISTPWGCPYQYSTQMAIWDRKLLLSCLRREMSPWDFELQDRQRPELKVMGTRNAPVRYLNGVGMSLDTNLRYRIEHIREGLGGTTIERLEPEHLTFMLEHGILPPQEKS